jgi:hypothetical protein
VNVESLSGQVRLEGATSIPTRFKFEARFGLTRAGVPLTGLVRVDAELRQLGQTRPIEPPQAEELQTRQRTILEERALLGRAGGAEGKEK